MSYLAILIIPAGFALFAYLDRVEARHPWVSIGGYAALSAFYAGLLIAAVLSGEVTWVTWFDAIFAGVFAWEAWRRWRRRKDRKPSRVLGVIRDLGHRLAVVPAEVAL